MFDLPSWAFRLLTALQSPPRSRTRPASLRLESLSDRLLLSTCSIATLADRVTMHAEWAKSAVSADSGSPKSDSPFDLRGTLLVRDGSAVYRLTGMGATLRISEDRDPAEAGKGIPAMVNHEVSSGGDTFTITFGSSASVRLLVQPDVRDGAIGSEAYPSLARDLTASIPTPVGDLILHVDYEHHEFREWIAGEFAVLIATDDPTAGAPSLKRDDRETSGHPRDAGPTEVSAPDAALLPSLVGYAAGHGLEHSPDEQFTEAATDDEIASALWLDADPRVNPLSSDWNLPAPRAELAPLESSNRSVVPAFLVGEQETTSKGDQPGREGKGPSPFVIGLGEPQPAAPSVVEQEAWDRSRAPAGPVYEEKETLTEGQLRVLLLPPPSDQTADTPAPSAMDATGSLGVPGAAAGAGAAGGDE